MLRIIVRSTRPSVALLMFLAAWSVVTGAPSVPQGNNWASIEHLPDWSGVWQATEFRKHFYEAGVVPWKDLDVPFKPESAAKFAELKKISLGHGDIPTRSDHCISLGVPGDMDYPQTRFQWIFTPGQVTVAGSEFLRRIYTDGRPHFTEIETFQGHSTGHWERGGVLVVDTVALDPGNEFILGFRQGANSHVVERFHLQSRDLLVDDVTLFGPRYYPSLGAIN